MPPATTIDKATKVNLGILGTLVVSAVGGGIYLGTLRTEFGEVKASIGRMERSIDKIAAQAQVDGRDLAMVRARLDALELRIQALEKHD